MKEEEKDEKDKENIKCMNKDCKNYIKNLGIQFIPKLNKEEIIAELNDLIDKHNYEKIHSCVCANCLHEYIILMKQKIEEEKIKHNNSMIALKDLLLDISNDDITDISHSVINDKEKNTLKNKYNNLKKERIELEKTLNNNKKELIKLKNDEENLCIKLNKNMKEKEENKEIIKKLKIKLNYLKKEYDDLIKEDDKKVK